MENGFEKHSGHLFKIERSVVGQVRRKYWFVLPFDIPTLYWFKNSTDFNCVGRISLSGAAFTFNPREIGTFEIHVNSEDHVLEALSNKHRIEWLSALQANRKSYYDRRLDTPNDFKEISKLTLSFTKTNENQLIKNDVIKTMCTDNKTQLIKINVDNTNNVSCSQSTFYLDKDGELNRYSLCLPDEKESIRCGNFDNFLTQAITETQNIERTLETPKKKIINKARKSMKKFSDMRESINVSSKCDKCQENIEIASQLKNRCYELTDELVACQDLVSSLKQSLVRAHNQRDSLAKLCSENSTITDKIDLVLKRESVLATTQCTITELRQEIEQYKEENKALESENNSLNVMIDAFKESIKTKDELILKFHDNSDVNFIQPIPIQLKKNSSDSEEVPEAIMFDYTNANADIDLKKVLTETSVNDINEMKDLVDGYSNQNKFLNNEVIELQKIIQSLEERERKLIRQNFDIEAVYYQLKSRYIMVLNHFRFSTNSKRLLDSSVIQNLINEVSQPSLGRLKDTNIQSNFNSNSYLNLITSYKSLNSNLTPKVDAETDSLGFYLNSPKSRCKKLVEMLSITKLNSMCPLSNSSLTGSEQDEISNSMKSDPFSAISHTTLELSDTISVTETVNSNTIIFQTPSTSISSQLTNSLISCDENTQTDDWMVRVAADLKKRSDDIWENISLGDNKDYIEWLQRWDSFLVNHVLQPLPGPGPSLEFKTLIRFGIPHAYRSRIWKNLVQLHIKNTEVEMGKGYYECLLKKAELCNDNNDSALKQIDLDLIRTLPTNKQFDKANSEKAQSLKRVLYAFRFHNKVVEYCQGLNRIAAIGLLYLREADAFWFLVACVEHLQPPDYYNHNLLGAILLDLVQKKIPALWDHLKKLEVDLSLFTLSWFLTIFVDALTHNIYINIFDVFLYEGNKVLFRFALALLKLCESKVLQCTSLTGVQACLSDLSSMVNDYKTLANIAFKQINPLASKTIEIKRQQYISRYKVILLIIFLNHFFKKQNNDAL